MNCPKIKYYKNIFINFVQLEVIFKSSKSHFCSFISPKCYGIAKETCLGINGRFVEIRVTGVEMHAENRHYNWPDLKFQFKRPILRDHPTHVEIVTWRAAFSSLSSVKEYHFLEKGHPGRICNMYIIKLFQLFCEVLGSEY